MHHTTRALAVALLISAPVLAQGNLALHVDGSDSALFIPRDVSLEPPDALTLEAWVLAEAPGLTFLRKSDSFQDGYFVTWWFQTPQITAVVDCGAGIQVKDPHPNDTYLGAWHHIAMTVEKAGACTLIIDGVYAASLPVPGACLAHSGDLWFGAHLGVFDEFTGFIDEVRLWSVARTPEQIAGSMHLILEGEPGLISSWHLDGDGLDSTAGNHGEPFGDASFEPSDAPLSTIVVSPRSGPWTGGTAMTLVGDFAGLSEAPLVSIGGVPATGVVLLDESTIELVVPAARAPGTTADIVVEGSGLLLTTHDTFLYTPRLSGPAAVLADGALTLDLDLTPPASLAMLVGRPTSLGTHVPHVAWKLQMLGATEVFHASAPIQGNVSASMPVSAFSSIAGHVLRFQARTVPLVAGGATASFSNAVDVTIE